MSVPLTRDEAIWGDDLDTWLGGGWGRNPVLGLALIQIEVVESSFSAALKKRVGALTEHQSHHLSR